MTNFSAIVSNTNLERQTYVDHIREQDTTYANTTTHQGATLAITSVKEEFKAFLKAQKTEHNNQQINDYIATNLTNSETPLTVGEVRDAFKDLSIPATMPGISCPVMLDDLTIDHGLLVICDSEKPTYFHMYDLDTYNGSTKPIKTQHEINENIPENDILVRSCPITRSETVQHVIPLAKINFNEHELPKKPNGNVTDIKNWPSLLRHSDHIMKFENRSIKDLVELLDHKRGSPSDIRLINQSPLAVLAIKSLLAENISHADPESLTALTANLLKNVVILNATNQRIEQLVKNERDNAKLLSLLSKNQLTKQPEIEETLVKFAPDIIRSSAKDFKTSYQLLDRSGTIESEPLRKTVQDAATQQLVEFIPKQNLQTLTDILKNKTLPEHKEVSAATLTQLNQIMLSQNMPSHNIEELLTIFENLAAFKTKDQSLIKPAKQLEANILIKLAETIPSQDIQGLLAIFNSKIVKNDPIQGRAIARLEEIVLEPSSEALFVILQSEKLTRQPEIKEALHKIILAVIPKLDAEQLDRLLGTENIKTIEKRTSSFFRQKRTDIGDEVANRIKSIIQASSFEKLNSIANYSNLTKLPDVKSSIVDRSKAIIPDISTKDFIDFSKKLLPFSYALQLTEKETNTYVDMLANALPTVISKSELNDLYTINKLFNRNRQNDELLINRLTAIIEKNATINDIVNMISGKNSQLRLSATVDESLKNRLIYLLNEHPSIDDITEILDSKPYHGDLILTDLLKFNDLKATIEDVITVNFSQDPISSTLLKNLSDRHEQALKKSWL